MRQRTPSEIKAYGDGYAEAYKEFCHLLDRHDKDKAIRKMKIFADAVALTVETATDTADTPQTDCIIANAKLKAHCLNCVESGSYKCTKCDGEMYYKDTPQTDCGWK